MSVFGIVDYYLGVWVWCQFGDVQYQFGVGYVDVVGDIYGLVFVEMMGIQDYCVGFGVE